MMRMAMRNLFRQRRRSILTMLTMLGGFVLAAFSIAWVDGSYNTVIQAFTRNRLGHIQIHAGNYLDKPSIYKTIDDLDGIQAALEETESVEQWTPRLFAYGLGSVGDETTAVKINGIDPVREQAATRFDQKVKKGRGLSPEADREVVLGEGLARQLKADLGDELVIVSQGADGSIANDAYSIIGFVASGDPMADRMDCYLHLDDAMELMVLEGRVHEIAITVDSLDDVKPGAREIAARLDNDKLSVETWQEFAASFYRAMRADRQGNWITLAVILLIVAVGVLNTVLMSVLERRREYGVLLALGTRGRRLVGLVLGEVLLLAILSILIGCVVAFLINYWVSIEGIRLSEPFTYGGVTFDVLKTEINLRSFVLPAVIVLVTAVLVALGPAVMAIRTDPARSMRMH